MSNLSKWPNSISQPTLRWLKIGTRMLTYHVRIYDLAVLVRRLAILRLIELQKIKDQTNPKPVVAD